MAMTGGLGALKFKLNTRFYFKKKRTPETAYIGVVWLYEIIKY